MAKKTVQAPATPISPLRYFYARNVNRLIGGVQFDPCGNFAGTTTGVFATEDRGIAERLKHTQGVEEISADVFRDKKKLTTEQQRNFEHSYVIPVNTQVKDVPAAAPAPPPAPSLDEVRTPVDTPDPDDS